MWDFLDDNNVLNNCQYGFRKNHSTEHALHDAITHVCKALNAKKKALGLYIDFSKAFDAVQHSISILIHKVEHYGISGRPLQLLSSYLSNRKQFCKIEENLSE